MLWLFDIDGTLIRAGGAGSAAMSAALSETFGVEADLQGIAFAGRTDREIIANLFSRHGIPWESSRVQRFREAYLERLPGTLRQCAGQVLAGVLPWLEILTNRDHLGIGLITGNMQASAQVKLEHFGLWHHFAFGGFGDEHADRNHVAAAALQAAADHLAFAPRPEETWIVGDTPHDIACARANGANVIAVATGGFDMPSLAQHRPDILVPDLSDVGVLLHLLAKAR